MYAGQNKRERNPFLEFDSVIFLERLMLWLEFHENDFENNEYYIILIFFVQFKAGKIEKG